MTKAIEIVLQCIEKGITDKQTIARELVKAGLYTNLDPARSMVRRMTGAAGKEVPAMYLKVYNKYKAAVDAEDQYSIASKKELKDSRVYLVTAALNNTPVLKPFWQNLRAYADYLDAELHVIALRYRNPTSVFTDRGNDEWTADVLPYLDANHHMLFDKFHLMANVKIQPTAEYPLSGLNGMSGDQSCIFGHSKVHMQFMPVLKGAEQKMMITTGVCTQPNYTDSKAGRKGEFHHTYGFVIVTQDDAHYVTACSDGSFIDCDLAVKDGIVAPAPPVHALILGDIHYSKLSHEAVQRIFHRIEVTQTPVVVLHDVFDGESINPHSEKDAVNRYQRHAAGNDLLEEEISDTLQLIKELCERTQVVIVYSNHDAFLDRYIANMDWKKDINNAGIYARLLPIALEEEGGVFAYLARRDTDAIVLGEDDSYVVDDVELGVHGHLGQNGSRGSAQQFKNLSTKIVIGHSHSPARLDGLCVVGCQDLDHGYNKGLSSWAIADVIINADGKRQHLLK